jgi:hypothetical protein
METLEEWWYNSAQPQFRQYREISAQEGQLCVAAAFTLLPVGKTGREVSLGAVEGRKIFSSVEN